MKTKYETQSLEKNITRRGFVSVTVGATAVAAALSAIVPTPASAQGAAAAPSSLVKLEKPTPHLWQVTIANPPFNLVVLVDET